MVKKFDPELIYPALGQYYNAVELEPKERLIFSSGIVGYTKDGILLDEPEAQIKQAWMNVAGFLQSFGMTTENLVRLKMHLTNRDLLPISRKARIETLGEHMNAAVTGVIVQLFDSSLFIEIDVVAARKVEATSISPTA